MAAKSAGILMFRRAEDGLQVLLVHPGGPFWARKDRGAWSIPKGEYTDADPEATARREFAEELGSPAMGPLLPLGTVVQGGGKTVTAFGLEGDLDPTCIVSNTFSMDWPPRSGHLQTFPEIDRAAWFTVEAARQRLLKGQLPFLDRLVSSLETG